MQRQEKVVFLINKNNSQLFAYFPEIKNSNIQNKIKWNSNSLNIPNNIDINYIKQCRLAKPYEYYELKNKLESIGYKLQIINE